MERKDGGGLLIWTRLLFGAAIVGGLLLGYRGLAAFVAQGDRWDLVYYDLQLFVLSSNALDQPGPYPVGLSVARFLLPAATLYAIFEATRALFARQLGRWYQRSVRRGHVIVTGQSSTALAVFERFERDRRQHGRRRPSVVLVPQAETAELVAAGVGGASAVYACAELAVDSTVNVSTALAAINTRPRGRGGRPPRVYAQVDDATLALALRARRLGLGSTTDHMTARDVAGLNQDVDFFNVDELAAGAVMDLSAVDIPYGSEPHILVAGAGSTFGRAAIVAYAYHWKLHSPRRHETVTVTLVDPRARAVAAELRSRWDIVDEALVLQPVDGDLATAFHDRPDLIPHRAYVCYEDEDLALREALTVAPLWRGGPDSVIVRLSRLHRHGAAFRGPSGVLLLDDLGGRLRLSGVTKLASEAGVIERSLLERLAQSIHEQYMLQQYRGGVATGAAVTPWSELSEGFRDANRAQAHDIGVKLARIGCTVAPRVGPVGPFAFTASEVDELARHEHERWSAERRAAGWKYGPQRDDRRKIHPSLVEWAQLSEAEREKDRDTVRLLPPVLAQVGLRIVRLASGLAADSPERSGSSGFPADSPERSGSSGLIQQRTELSGPFSV